MFVATFWLNGGLNQITFRERVLRFALPCSFRRSRYSVSALNPLSRSALSYNGLASAKTSLLLEMSVKQRLIEAGRFLSYSAGGSTGDGCTAVGRWACETGKSFRLTGSVINQESRQPLNLSGL